MAKVIFTPWKTHADLLTVRSQFYPAPDYEGSDLRSHACATVGAWKLRGNLPHSVEATALLTDAILHDDAQKNSVFSIRATYSAAFCRFVTGLVDSKLYGARKSMFGRAMDLGLPASFVELRHEATHRELPSLTVLRDSTVRSLTWLWDFYWRGVTHAVEPGIGLGGLEMGEAVRGDGEGDGVEVALRGSLEQARALVDGVSSGSSSVGEPPKKKRRVQQELASVATQVVSTLKELKGVTVLVRALLRDETLVPSGRRLGDSMAEVIDKWDPFLQSVAEGYPSFVVTLVETMVDELAFSSSPNTKSDPFCEGVYTWLDHILRSGQWSTHRRVLSYSYIQTVCEGSTNHWTTLLKKSLGKKGNNLPAISSPHSSDEPPSISEIDDDLKTLRNFGWEPADSWDNRQLGIV